MSVPANATIADVIRPSDVVSGVFPTVGFLPPSQLLAVGNRDPVGLPVRARKRTGVPAVRRLRGRHPPG